MNALYTLDNSPLFEWIELNSIDSTNNFVRNYKPVTPKEIILVTADYQTSGKGQSGNTWEAANGKNLLFSLRLHPVFLEANKQFILSQAISLAVQQTLLEYTPDISIKWPNDIYWKDHKIGGILIENTLYGRQLEMCVIGVGININQPSFASDAPNPVSLFQILHRESERLFILARIIEAFKRFYQLIKNGETQTIIETYRKSLYRGEGYHSYADKDGAFEAAIHAVEPNGYLVLKDNEGKIRKYAFKEVRYLIPLSPDNLQAI